MSSITIHNVSDRPSIGVEASAYKIAGHWLRPGKQVTVPTEAVNSKLKALHGKCLWFGKLPPVLVSESRSNRRIMDSRPAPMSKESAREYLDSCDMETLKGYTQSTTPAVKVLSNASKSVLALRISMACFSSSVILDPEAFFWLGRWHRSTTGDFVENQ